MTTATARRTAKKKSTTSTKPVAKKAAATFPTAIALADLPRIGADLAGGKFRGLVRGETEGSPDIALIDLGYSTERMSFDKAQKWAEKHGGVAPDRAEARVLWANGDLQDEKRPSDYFWLRTLYAGSESCAWSQYFNYGHQNSYHKDNELRARAVRRLTIQ